MPSTKKLTDFTSKIDKMGLRLRDRPKELHPLFSKLTLVQGLGAAAEKKLQKIDIKFPKDLLFHIPIRYLYRKPVSRLNEINPPETITITIEVGKYYFSQSVGPSKVLVNAENFSFFIVFFKIKNSFIENNFPIGEQRIVSGRLEVFDNELQMIHPDYILKVTQKHEVKTHDPIYQSTAGLTSKYLGKLIRNSLILLDKNHDWLDNKFLTRNGWPEFKEALFTVHNSNKNFDIETVSSARKRLIFDEFFAHSISLLLAKLARKKEVGRKRSFSNRLSKALIDSLKFSLTDDQKLAINEINNDLCSSLRMNRLLQGDVGSGKTIVALATMLNIIEKGGQVVLLAPTEILAIQHFTTIHNLISDSDINMTIFSGSDKGEVRREKLQAMSNGASQIIIGTHALFQEEVNYFDLQYVVIDEQHRFGVNQRNSMIEKGQKVDLLMMSATPIPRSLYMVRYGDLDVSLLREKPINRKPIKTALISTNKIVNLLERLKTALKTSQAYWICPLIEASEKVDLIAAKNRFSEVSKFLDDFKIGLLHGKLSSAEKDEVMNSFSSGKIDLLISTTVIEVGVDVPNASIMIIEGAERFGLAQLHQIRGRVGRGDKDSSCTLVFSEKLSAVAMERLKKLRNCEDGFEIAEFDLTLRGEGEVVGARQSGMPKFKIGDPFVDNDILKLARIEAERLLNEDPFLESNRGNNVIYLLNLMEKINIFY